MRILGSVLLLCTLVPVGRAQERGQVMIDVVENDRRCHNDAGLVRECDVAYGHYKDYPAFSPVRQLFVFRIALLCERVSMVGVVVGNEEHAAMRARKDCIPLEAGKTYKWSVVAIDEHYPYTLYEDFASAMYIVTPQGKALYAIRTLDSVR